MRMVFAVLCLMALAACGVDGEPIQPSMDANLGIGQRGVSGSIGTGIVHGNVSVHVGTTI